MGEIIDLLKTKKQQKNSDLTSRLVAVSRLDLLYVSESRGCGILQELPFWGDSDGSRFHSVHAKSGSIRFGSTVPIAIPVLPANTVVSMFSLTGCSPAGAFSASTYNIIYSNTQIHM